jgi:hypothetical protein
MQAAVMNHTSSISTPNKLISAKVVSCLHRTTPGLPLRSIQTQQHCTSATSYDIGTAR